ncbi:NADPH-dependent 2,4-dienoyl-CoA reductase, sulfur reductase [Desulfacinum hydrothermale DSM 13146]|uniref:NADPH-dependent 2,4-dienoyl-CoA reductase, sulfur reductase n=1 Tax=Desulfacinum hydrothermale DSM 13146 TaxID=1121390 RepID=A0A1W1X1P4_9BACT|nr:FAD-dependent oxidoreductase [Desulfacinum hydrothermale]SMC17824.1 NADPH-dependent 2,4-dienoyl-CoA reductase, sulfur reductase [Desulfacinum hydrothermale DSM 13146]
MDSRLKVVVIGGVACGPKAASRLKRLLPDADITMVEREDVVSYGACGLPYYVEGMFPDVRMLTETPVGVSRTPVFFEKAKGFRVLVRTEAVSIDREARTVKVRNLDNGKEDELAYDKLIIATGASPFRPPIPGLELDNVWFMKRLEDATGMVDNIEAQGLRRAVLVGAGLIGLEVAEALRVRGLDVTIVEMFDQIMPQVLDREMAALAAKHLESNGIRLVLGERVTAVEGNGKVEAVRTNQQVLPADLVLVAVGVRPNDRLAREAGLDCDPRGGIRINAYCQTSDPHIYAGGDCVVNDYVHPITGATIYVPLGSTANKHGRVIANHIAGLTSPFLGVSGTSICKVFGYTMGRTGLTEKQARELNLDCETVLWSGPDRPHYMEGSQPIVIKLIASKRYRRLLGAQVVGLGDGAKRLDVAASAILFEATLDHLEYVDLAYAPPFSPPIDPIVTAAHVLLNKLNGLANGISPLEARKRMEEQKDLILLDVRTPQEFEAVRLPDERVVHIPLGALRERWQELPKDKDILAFCKVSMRGYEAQRILNAHGYDRVCFIEGGLLAWPFELWTPGT